jgi:hypothetical protein
MYQKDQENELSQELLTLQGSAQNLRTEELDRDYSEVLQEIAFLDDQLSADIDCYTPGQLTRAYEKISNHKRKAEILRIELTRRPQSSVVMRCVERSDLGC